MNIVPTSNNAPVLVVDGVYSQEELALVWRELDFLTSPIRLQHAEKTFTAVGDSGVLKKNATGVFLDTFYGDRSASDILSVNRKLFCNEIKTYAEIISPFYKALHNVNNDYTLINYYDNEQEYGEHKDASAFTAVTFFFKEPVQFDGGDLVFPEFDLVVEKKNNRLVLFPGAFQHAATPVKMTSTYPPFSGFGRYSMAQLLYIKSK